MAENITLTKDQLQELLSRNGQAIAENVGKAFIEGIKELKKPSEEEQEKLDNAKKRREQNRQAAVRDGIAEQILRAQEQLRCGHTKENGCHTFGGRVLNNGDASVTCSRCSKEYRWQATRDQSADGGALHLQSPEHGYFRMSGPQIEKWFLAQEQNYPAKQPAKRPDLQQLMKEKDVIEARFAKAV